MTLLKYYNKPGSPSRVEFSQQMLWQHITSGILIVCDETLFSVKGLKHLVYTGELHLSGLIGTASYPYMQKKNADNWIFL